ncbi:phage tail protein [uncultured Pseudomonas sp.]|uniref:phage tail protein n=1 Tax=uncultured Pseudomonas sp. TaxID=114707 RepID=UPI0025ECC1FA|nr:phage tail protein [uncultured Pseudomonas sp.]
MVQAGEAGRHSIDDIMGPVNGAISEISGAADEIASLPGVPPEVGAKLQRVMRGIGAAQSKVGTVLATYSKATRTMSGIDERMGTLKEQAYRAGTAINQVAGKVDPRLANILPTSVLAPNATPLAEAVKPFPHLLILQPLQTNAQPFYFNLDTAAFDELRRQTEFRWASQERLSRRPAQQAVGMGEEKLSLKGAIFPTFKGGLKQLDTLRTIGAQMLPLNLTTGYGVVLGTWCLRSLEEEQGALLAGGIPRKQTSSLEFTRYGDDMQNV